MIWNGGFHDIDWGFLLTGEMDHLITRLASKCGRFTFSLQSCMSSTYPSIRLCHSSIHITHVFHVQVYSIVYWTKREEGRKSATYSASPTSHHSSEDQSPPSRSPSFPLPCVPFLPSQKSYGGYSRFPLRCLFELCNDHRCDEYVTIATSCVRTKVWHLLWYLYHLTHHLPFSLTLSSWASKRNGPAY